MKKSILFMMLSSLLLASCVDGGGDEQPTDESGNKIVKIMFHVDKNSSEGKAYQKLISDFNAEYEDQKIKAAATFKARTAGGADYEQQLIALQIDNDLPDIITFDAPNCASYADADLLYDVTNDFTQEEKDDFLSLNTYQGKIYGLPIQESSAGFFYNKRIFADAGINVSSYTVENKSPWSNSS